LNPRLDAVSVRDIRTDADLAVYLPDVLDFRDYLTKTSLCHFRITGTKESETVVSDVEYIHRWTDTYRRSWIAKLYLLEAWHKREGLPVTLLTLTTYQNGWYSHQKGRNLAIPESFDALKTGWRKLTKILRKELRTIEYFWVMEPHESGYPHMHVMLFSEISPGLQDKISSLWELYGAGSRAHGVDFEIRPEIEGIRSLRNYLLKYLAKGLQGTDSKFGDDPLLPGHWVFHSQVWKYKYRIVGSSRLLSRVMAYNAPERHTEWVKTELIDSNGDIHPVTAKTEPTGLSANPDFSDSPQPSSYFGGSAGGVLSPPCNPLRETYET